MFMYTYQYSSDLWSYLDFCVILRLHYVPGGPGSPVCLKRSVPWNFGHIFLCFQYLLLLIKFSYVVLGYP